MFEKGQELELYIEDMSNQGQGIGKADGFAIFVPGVVPGDTIKCELTKIKKNFGFGKVTGIITPSPDRVKPVCKYFYDCGGCDLGELSYEGQLALKEKQVIDKLSRLGKLENPKVNQIIGMEEPYYYRNKAVMQISTGGNIMRKGGIIENLDAPRVGFFRKKSHEVVDCKECLLQNPASMAAADAIRRFMEEDNITAWDEKWQQGLMKQMTVKTAFGTGQVMVIITINGKGIPNFEKLVYMMDEYIAEAGYSLESIYIDNNKDLVNIAGSKVIRKDLGGISFEISPRSFYQVNPVMTIALYDKVKEYANLTGSETVLDLYCGVGSIGLWCADGAKSILGIEVVKEAVIDANRNAVINGIVNARYITGKAEDVLSDLMKIGTGVEVSESEVGKYDKEPVKMAMNADVVILDPPRSGCHEDLLDAVTKVAPERIVYVSCDPATLARDVRVLTEKGYKFIEATPFDVFCGTGHVECVVLMSRV